MARSRRVRENRPLACEEALLTKCLAELAHDGLDHRVFGGVDSFGSPTRKRAIRLLNELRRWTIAADALASEASDDDHEDPFSLVGDLERIRDMLSEHLISAEDGLVWKSDEDRAKSNRGRLASVARVRGLQVTSRQLALVSLLHGERPRVARERPTTATVEEIVIDETDAMQHAAKTVGLVLVPARRGRPSKPLTKARPALRVIATKKRSKK